MAGVAGGALAAAVSAAGGIGFIGGGYGDAWIDHQLDIAGDQSVGVGLITWALARPPPGTRAECGARWIWLSFGDATPHLKVVHAAGAIAVCQVQTTAEARVAMAGADVIVAQGQESGGHDDNDRLADLLPAVVDAVAPVPVLAGAITTAADRQRASAAAAESSSARLASHEALDTDAAKAKLVESSVTHRTTVFDLVRGPIWPATVAEPSSTRPWSGGTVAQPSAACCAATTGKRSRRTTPTLRRVGRNRRVPNPRHPPGRRNRQHDRRVRRDTIQVIRSGHRLRTTHWERTCLHGRTAPGPVGRAGAGRAPVRRRRDCPRRAVRPLRTLRVRPRRAHARRPTDRRGSDPGGVRVPVGAPQADRAGTRTLRGFLGTLTHRRAVDAVRREESAGAGEVRVARHEDSVPDVADVVLRSDTTGRVRNAVEVLPDAQRQALELAYFDGYTYRQVAEVLGIPEGTAKSRLRLALTRIAEHLGPELSKQGGRSVMSIDEPHEPLISPDDLAAYALDAHDAVIAAHLDTSPDAVRREQDLRSAAGEFAAAIVDEVSPRPSCVSGSSPRRAGAAPAEVVAGASPIDVHRLEMARAILLLAT